MAQADPLTIPRGQRGAGPSPGHPKGVDIDMTGIILSNPGFCVCLALIWLWLLAAVCTRPSGPPVGGPRAPAPTAGRASPTHRQQYAAAWTGPPGGVPPCGPGPTARVFRDLQATLSAGYAATVEQAIRTIRLGPPHQPGQGGPAGGK